MGARDESGAVKGGYRRDFDSGAMRSPFLMRLRGVSRHTGGSGVEASCRSFRNGPDQPPSVQASTPFESGRRHMSQIEQNRNGKRRDYLSSYQTGFGGCWIYTGSINNRGYGTILGRAAHRFFYKAIVGDIPKGMQLDHLCRTRACVNPEHLEPVTQSENMRRANRYCRRGHLMSEENTYRYMGRAGGYSTCRICKNEAKRRDRLRAKGA